MSIDSRAPTTSEDRVETWGQVAIRASTLMLVACLVPMLLEAGRLSTFQKSVLGHVPIASGPFLLGFASLGFLAAVAHFVPLVLFETALLRWAPRLAPWFWPAIAAALVFGMQHAALQGEGARSSAYYRVLAPALATLLPLLAFGVIAGLLYAESLSSRLRRIALFAIVVEAWAFNLFVLTRYQQFHAFLTALNIVLTVLALRTVAFPTGRLVRLFTGGLLLVALVSLPMLSDRTRLLRAVVRYTHFASSSLQYWPLARPWTPPARAAIDPHRQIPALDAQRFEARLAPSTTRDEPLGRNLLFLVLESTRHDDWADERVAPSFRNWRRHGVYFPRAIAAFPATTLGYGAMLTSQPPSVLAHTQRWAKDLPFSRIAARVDKLALTKAVDIPDHIAIDDYLAPPSARVNRHENAEDALAYLRAELSPLAASESFAAWAHLYEPHHPWELRPEHRTPDANEPPTVHDAYRSELRYLDHHLGHFMEWFYRQPFALDTLVIVIADHGEGMGDLVDGKAFFSHNAHPHTAVSWIPAFVSGPGLPPDRVVDDRIFAQLDVLPTILDFFAMRPPKELWMQGRSAYELLESPKDLDRSLPTEVFGFASGEFFKRLRGWRDGSYNESTPRSSLINDAFQPQIALQRGSWKLHHDLVLDRFRLYDLESDPGEQTDLASQRPDQLTELRKHLDEWLLQQSWVIQRLESSSPSTVR